MLVAASLFSVYAFCEVNNDLLAQRLEFLASEEEWAKKIALYAALGSGESVTLSKDDVTLLLGKQEAKDLLVQAQRAAHKVKKDRSFFWNSLKIGLFFTLNYAVMQMKSRLSFGKRLLIAGVVGGLLGAICDAAQEHYS